MSPGAHRTGASGWGGARCHGRGVEEHFLHYQKAAIAIPSQHIGDLENYETLQFAEETLRNLRKRVPGEAETESRMTCIPITRLRAWALRRAEPKIAVQHHHAHIVRLHG